MNYSQSVLGKGGITTYLIKNHSKVWAIILMLSLIFTFIPFTPVYATAIAFHKEQSYELSDLIHVFMIDENRDYVSFLQI